MSYWDKECPRDSYDAYREGRRSRSYDSNPYEHGSDPWADRDCQEAHREWERGHRAAEYEREEERREEEARERRAAERRAYEREQEEREYYGE